MYNPFHAFRSSYRFVALLLILGGVQIGIANLAQDDTAVTNPVLTLATTNTSASHARWNADLTRVMTWGRLFPSSGTAEFHAQVWDAVTGDLLLSVQQEALSTLATDTARWNADESRLLTSAGFSARIWDAQSGQALHEFRHESGISGARWNSSESRLLTWEYNGGVHVWNTDTGDLLLTVTYLREDGRHVEFVEAAWINDDTQIFGHSRRGLHIWDAETGDLIEQFLSESLINAPTWNQHEDRVLFGAEGGATFFWSPQSGAVKHFEAPDSFDPLFVWVDDVGWNSDETRIFSHIKDSSSLEDGLVYVWDTASGSLLHSLPHEGRVNCCVTWHPDGELLLSVDGAVYVWDTTSGTLRYHLQAPADDFLGARWGPDGTRFAIWNRSTTQVRDTATGEPIIMFDGGGFEIFWRPDGKQLLTVTPEAGGQIWQVESAQHN